MTTGRRICRGWAVRRGKHEWLDHEGNWTGAHSLAFWRRKQDAQYETWGSPEHNHGARVVRIEIWEGGKP